LKILLLADGRSAHTIRYQKALIDQGQEVVLASLERGDTVDIRLKKKSVSNSLNYFFVNRQINDIAQKILPDIINPHFASGYGFSTAISKTWKRYPVLLHCLGSDILISPAKSIAHRRKVILALSRADRILVDSEYLKQKTAKLYNRIRIDTIPWGVEKEILEIYQFKKQINFKFNDPPKILVPRPHQRVYNNPFVIEALADLVNNKKVSLTFPGWGDWTEEFKKIINKHCPDGTINLYSFLERSEYLEMLADHDIYLSASKSDSSPASLIESMGAGLYPVAADIPGVKEWINERNSILFELGETASLRNSVEKLFYGNMNISSVLETNHKKVKSEAVFRENIMDTIKIMEELINASRK